MARVLALLACSASACFFAPERPFDGLPTGDARGSDDGGGGGGNDAATQDAPSGSCTRQPSDDFSDAVVEPCGTWGTAYAETGVSLDREGQQLLVEFGTGGGLGGCFVGEHIVTNGVSIRVDLSYLDTTGEKFQLQLTAPMQSPLTNGILVTSDGARRYIAFEHPGAVAVPSIYNGPIRTVFRIVPTVMGVAGSYLDANNEWVAIGELDNRDARGLGTGYFAADGLAGTQARFDDLNLFTCPP